MNFFKKNNFNNLKGQKILVLMKKFKILILVCCQELGKTQASSGASFIEFINACLQI